MFTPKQRAFILKVVLCLCFPLFTQGQIHHVILDAGHGGKDPGAVAFGVSEKDVALSVTLKLGKLIQEELPEIDVSYTREEDVFIELYQRAKIANKKEGDFFISIHANAATNQLARGTETFVLGLHRNSANLEVVKRENAVISLEGESQQEYIDISSPEAQILLELHQQNYLDQSIQFAGMVENQFTKRTGLKSRGVKQAGFLVLYKTSMPSVLIELGFLTHRDECIFLSSETGQAILAESIFYALKEFVENNTLGPESLTLQQEATSSQQNQENVAAIGKKIKTYRVQLFATGKVLGPEHPVYSFCREVYTERSGSLTRVLTESIASEKEAKKLKEHAKGNGYKDAYIVTYIDGIRQ